MILQWIAGLIGGPIARSLLEGYKAKLDAGNTSERIAADLKIRELTLEEKTREFQTKLLVAEQGRWYTAIVRPAFALILWLYFAKIVVWDKLLGWGVTDPLDGAVGEWAGWIIMAYFGGRSVEKVARILRR